MYVEALHSATTIDDLKLDLLPQFNIFIRLCEGIQNISNILQYFD